MGKINRTMASIAGLLLLSACTADALPNPLRQQAASTQVNPQLEPTRTPAPASTLAPTKVPAPTATTATKTDQTEAATTTPKSTARQTQYELCSAVKPAIASVPPALPDSTGMIVFITTDGNIALTDITGRSRINITTDAYLSADRQAGRIYQFPTFSSDGKSIAFVSLSTTSDFQGITQTVHVAPATNGSKVNDLYSTSEWGIPYLDFSPDGKQIAFLTINQTEGAVRVISSAGGDASTLETGSPMYWHWRSDSTAMLTHFNGRAEKKGDANIAVVDVNGSLKSGQQELDALPGAFQSPQFAPDGKHMLYVANAGGNDELVLAGADGKPVCTVMPIEANAYFAWSPDGGKVAVMDTQTPASLPAPLIVHDFAAGASKTVQDEASAFFWSPDGSRLATYRIVNNAPITSISMTSGKVNAPAKQQQQRVALRIETIDVASGQVTRVADTLPSQQFGQYLQYFDQYSRAVSPWSPDGKHMVFTTVHADGNTADVAVASFDSTQTGPSLKRVAAGVVAFWSPR
jgi:Tol biopolymer transport system component